MLLLVQHRHESGDIVHPRLFCLIVFCQRPPRLMFSSLALHSWQYSSWPEAFFPASGMLFYTPYNGFEVSEWSAMWELECFSLSALIIVARRDDFSPTSAFRFSSALLHLGVGVSLTVFGKHLLPWWASLWHNTIMSDSLSVSNWTACARRLQCHTCG